MSLRAGYPHNVPVWNEHGWYHNDWLQRPTDKEVQIFTSSKTWNIQCQAIVAQRCWEPERLMTMKWFMLSWELYQFHTAFFGGLPRSKHSLLIQHKICKIYCFVKLTDGMLGRNSCTTRDLIWEIDNVLPRFWRFRVFPFLFQLLHLKLEFRTA